MSVMQPAGAPIRPPDRRSDAGAVTAIRIEAMALARDGRREEAVAKLESWLSQRPNHPSLWLTLGDLRQQLGLLDQASEAWFQASRASGRLGFMAWLRIGNLRLQTADARGAREAFREAVRYNNEAAEAHCGLASAAALLGDFETVQREATAALALDPRCYPAWGQLSLVPEIGSDEIAAMRLAAHRATDDPRAWVLHIALGRVLERSGDFDDAFRSYTKGQQDRQRLFAIDHDRQLRYFRSIIDNFDKRFVRRRPLTETSGFRPIFIIGMPRSGTTLVETILSTHPQVAAGGEMLFIYAWLRENAGSAASASTAAWIANADDQTLARLAHEWHGVLLKARGSRDRVTDKLHLNFFHAGLIATCFPEARIVHVRRDARDTCVSCYATALSGNAIPARLDELGKFYRLYETLMQHWRNILGHEKFIEIEYEKLIDSPEPVIRKLLSDVDLSWHPDCMRHHETQRPIATASLHQVRRPLYKSSIGRWRRFEPHLAPLLQALNSPTSP